MIKNEVFLCAINNILSGSCAEDCSFCTQSSRYHADIERYTLKPIETILAEAKVAQSVGALGYCLVTAGRGLDDKKTEYIARAATAIKNELDGLNLIACNGLASLEQLKYLKDSGVDSYNHNLEASQEYYGTICTTHSWSDRYATCESAKLAGLSLCTGGIFGMGESENDRAELIKSVASLAPDSVTMNFYHPNPSLPIKERNISSDEALKIISIMKNSIGDGKILMVAGGRELIFAEREAEMFRAGANAIVTGNYLTTKGDEPSSDRAMLESIGMKIATSCEGLKN